MIKQLRKLPSCIVKFVGFVFFCLLMIAFLFYIAGQLNNAPLYVIQLCGIAVLLLTILTLRVGIGLVVDNYFDKISEFEKAQNNNV